MAETKTAQGSRKLRTGRVVSNKMDKTIIVTVERMVQHPLVKKFVRHHKKYYADDPENQCQVGDRVRIVECRPLSKNKRWRLTEVVEKAK